MNLCSGRWNKTTLGRKNRLDFIFRYTLTVKARCNVEPRMYFGTLEIYRLNNRRKIRGKIKLVIKFGQPSAFDDRSLKFYF